mmetsp:Transcript_93314/g.290961  ORF Transcript_93314/g.290961 Transcript_93314/m.290961 type:complete len:252 (+) Transcript_93314:391-1146(+)
MVEVRWPRNVLAPALCVERRHHVRVAPSDDGKRRGCHRPRLPGGPRPVRRARQQAVAAEPGRVALQRLLDGDAAVDLSLRYSRQASAEVGEDRVRARPAVDLKLVQDLKRVHRLQEHARKLDDLGRPEPADAVASPLKVQDDEPPQRLARLVEGLPSTASGAADVPGTGRPEQLTPSARQGPGERRRRSAGIGRGLAAGVLDKRSCKKMVGIGGIATVAAGTGGKATRMCAPPKSFAYGVVRDAYHILILA